MVIRGILWSAVGQGALTATAIFTAALVNRAISPDGRGVVAEVQTWVGLFVVLLGFSLSSAIYHFANRDRYALREGAQLYLVLLTSSGASVLATAAIAVLLREWPDIVSPQAYELRLLLLGLPAASIFLANLQALGVSQGRTRLVAMACLVMAVLSLVFFVPAYVAEAIDVRFVLSATLAVQIGGSLVILLVLLSGEGCFKAGITANLLWAFIAAGLTQHIGTVAFFACTRLNQLIVFQYWGEKETGLFAAAHALAFGCFAFFAAIQTGLYSVAARIRGDGLALTLTMLRIAFFFGLALVIPALLAADLLVRIYGGLQFADAVPSFRMLAVAAWILSVCAMTAPYFVRAGAFWLASINSLLLGLASLVLNVLLVPTFAAKGAAASTLLSAVFGFFGVLAMLRLISGTWHWRVLVPDFRKEYADVTRWLAAKRLADSS